MEEVHGFGVAAVFAADAELEPGLGRPTLVGPDLRQPADSVGVDGLEWRDGEDALLQVGGEYGGLDVVAGEAPGGLGQVVGAEGEEVGGLGVSPARSPAPPRWR